MVSTGSTVIDIYGATCLKKYNRNVYTALGSREREASQLCLIEVRKHRGCEISAERVLVRASLERGKTGIRGEL